MSDDEICKNCVNWIFIRQHHIQDNSINKVIGCCKVQHQLFSFDDCCVKFKKGGSEE